VPPNFDALERLALYQWRTIGRTEAAFAGLRAPRLAHLNLVDVEGTSVILAGLARNAQVRLRKLGVTLRERESWTGVFASAAFEHLHSLHLGIHGPDAAMLLEHANLPELDDLEILDVVELECLNLPSLRRVKLGAVELDARSLARFLARSPGLEQLRIARMPESEIDRVIDLALALPPDHPLRSLSLPIRDPEFAARLATRFRNEFTAV
jgi:hypothetical protein